MLIFEHLVKENQEQFIEKTKYIADQLGVDANWLMGVFYLECSLNHKAQNSSSGAYGLIQFMPSTAVSLGTTTAKLAQMSNVEQLDYVYQYLKPYKSKYNSFVDVYLAVFFPVAIGKTDDYVLKTSTLSAEKIAFQNRGYDLDQNSQLTKGEVSAAILAKIPMEYQDSIENSSKKKY